MTLLPFGEYIIVERDREEVRNTPVAGFSTERLLNFIYDSVAVKGVS